MSKKRSNFWNYVFIIKVMPVPWFRRWFNVTENDNIFLCQVSVCDFIGVTFSDSVTNSDENVLNTFKIQVNRIFFLPGL